MEKINYGHSHPCWKRYNAIRKRCNYPSHTAYKYYGAKGIKLLLTRQEIKFLWDRDKADLMKSPTIDRIDPKGNYELSNCRYIEQSENTRRKYEKTWFTKIYRKILENKKLILKKNLKTIHSILHRIRRNGYEAKQKKIGHNKYIIFMLS